MLRVGEEVFAEVPGETAWLIGGLVAAHMPGGDAWERGWLLLLLLSKREWCLA